MSLSTDTENAAMWINDVPLSSNETIKLIRQQGSLPQLIENWVLDKTLAQTHISPEIQQNLLDKYRTDNQLTSDEAYADHLQNRHINEALLLKILIRPLQVLHYREERWGPFTQSLYLQHKDQFDLVSYYRLESSNADVMREIYFRLRW